jgi:Spy/CpxP family protein refolding chaperone
MDSSRKGRFAMMSRRKINTGLAFSALLGLMLSASVVQAQPGWGQDSGAKMNDKPMAGHGHSKKGDWGGSMMSSGHMTARMRMVWNLDLSKDQREKIRNIQRDLRGKVWKLEDKIEDTSDQLFGMYKKSPRDAKAIGKVYGEIFDLRRQIIEHQIEAGNDVDDVLTKQQKSELHKWGMKPRWGSGWGSK